MRQTCAHWMRAFLPSQSTLSADSSGRAVAQSITMLTPTNVAGNDDGSVKSACNSHHVMFCHMPACVQSEG